MNLVLQSKPQLYKPLIVAAVLTAVVCFMVSMMSSNRVVSPAVYQNNISTVDTIYPLH